MVQNFDEKIEEVYQIADNLEDITGEEEVIFPKYKRWKEIDRDRIYWSKIQENLDYKKMGFVANLNHLQDTLLGQIITKEVFGQNGNRYAHLTTQSSYDKMYPDKNFITRIRSIIRGKEYGQPESDKNFRKIMKSYYGYTLEIHNREVILEKGRIIPDPIVVETDQGLRYEGKSIKVDIKDGVIDTLIEAGLFKEPKEKICRGWGLKETRGIIPNPFFEDGISSVMSDWHWPIKRDTYSAGYVEYRSLCCFGPVLYKPSVGVPSCISAFEKINEKAKI